MSSMVFFVVLGSVVLIEVVSIVLIKLTVRRSANPVLTRKALLADQTTKLSRLANEEGIRPRIHPTLGWDFTPGFSTPGDTLNSMGLRGLREYDLEPPPDVTRVAAFGDSFVYGSEAPDELCWTAQMEAMWQVEVPNYGVGGYGLDQAYLRYLAEGHALRPRTVLIGFYRNLAMRTVSRYRRFQHPGDGPWFKPRYVLDGDDLRLVPAPVASRDDALRLIERPELVREAGHLDYWYNAATYEHRFYEWSAAYRLITHAVHHLHRANFHPDRIYKGEVFNTDSQAFTILERICVRFDEAIRRNGAVPILIGFPTRQDIELFRRAGTTSYEPLMAVLRDRGLTVVDVVEDLAGSKAKLFEQGGHYSVEGNAIVAEAIGRALALERRASLV